MAKKDRKNSGDVEMLEEVSETNESDQGVETPIEMAVKKKHYYNAEAARRRRNEIMEFARKGGYEPKPRAARGDGGHTEKRVSKKSGQEYYYTPWKDLSPDEKARRLEQARERNRREREQARKYREEHPEEV